MYKPIEIHLKTALKVLVYIKNSQKRVVIQEDAHSHICVLDAGYTRDRGERKLTTSYLIFIGSNLVP